MPPSIRKANSLERRRTKKTQAHRSAPVGLAPPLALRERSRSFSMDASMAHLIAHTELVDSLTQWASGKVSEQLVSDAFVRMGNELNLVIAHLEVLAIPTREFAQFLPSFREILETCLSEETPGPGALNPYLPRLTRLMEEMKQSLQAKHLLYSRMVSTPHVPVDPPPASAAHRPTDAKSQHSLPGRSRASSNLTNGASISRVPPTGPSQEAVSVFNQSPVLPPSPDGRKEKEKSRGTKVGARLRSMRSRIQLQLQPQHQPQSNDALSHSNASSPSRRRGEQNRDREMEFQASEQSVFRGRERERDTQPSQTQSVRIPRSARHKQHQHESSLPPALPSSLPNPSSAFPPAIDTRLASGVGFRKTDDVALPSPTSIRSFRSHQLPAVRYNPAERFSLDDGREDAARRLDGHEAQDLEDDVASASHAYLWNSPTPAPRPPPSDLALAFDFEEMEMLQRRWAVAEKPVLPPLDLGSTTLSPTDTDPETGLGMGMGTRERQGSTASRSTATSAPSTSVDGGQSLTVSIASSLPPLTPPGTAVGPGEENHADMNAGGKARAKHTSMPDWGISPGIVLDGGRGGGVPGGVTETESLEALKKFNQLERRASKRRADFQNKKNSVELDSVARATIAAGLNLNVAAGPGNDVEALLEAGHDSGNAASGTDNMLQSTPSYQPSPQPLLVIALQNDLGTTNLRLDPSMTLSALWDLLVQSHGFSQAQTGDDAQQSPNFAISQDFRVSGDSKMGASGKDVPYDETMNRASGVSFLSVDSSCTVQAAPIFTPVVVHTVARKPVPQVSEDDSISMRAPPDEVSSSGRSSSSKAQAKPKIEPRLFLIPGPDTPRPTLARRQTAPGPVASPNATSSSSSKREGRRASNSRTRTSEVTLPVAPPIPAATAPPTVGGRPLQVGRTVSAGTNASTSTGSASIDATGQRIDFAVEGASPEEHGLSVRYLLSSTSGASSSQSQPLRVVDGDEPMVFVADACWIKFQWPGYGLWEMQLNSPTPGIPLTRTKLAQMVAGKFIQGLKRVPQSDSDPQWSVGPGKSVEYGDLKLLRLVHDSGSRWLAQFEHDSDDQEI